MKFSVGYQPLPGWIDAIVENAASVHDVYFAFGAMPSGRAGVADADRQLEDLGRIADAGIPLGLLFNANCYGARALSKAFFAEVGETVDRFAADGALKSVTTTSPLIARFVKDNFPGVAVRASVNMGIGLVWGMVATFLKMGEPLMGEMRYISFAVVMAGMVMFSSLFGVLLGEWRGTGAKTRLFLATGLVVLILSFVTISICK